MVGAISSISSLFVGSIAPRASVSSSSVSSSRSSSSNSITGVTDPQDVVAISGVRPPDPVSRHDPSRDDPDQDQNQQGQGQDQNQQQQAGINPSQKKLTQPQQDEVAKLKEIDRSVHLHEQAHAAAGGARAGAPHYSYTTGPDGNQYAVGGEVAISVPSIDSKDPQATIQQLRQVIAAATAPADPSGQDRSVAAQATAEIAQAQADQAKKAASGTNGSGGSDSADGTQETDDSDQSTPATGTTGKPTGTTKSAGQAAIGGNTASTGGDDAQATSIPIIGPAAFGTKKTADSSSGTGQSSGSTGDTSGTKVSAALIYAYQQVQSSTGQNRNRGSSALNLSV